MKAEAAFWQGWLVRFQAHTLRNEEKEEEKEKSAAQEEI